MGQSESKIEQYLVKTMKKLGGECPKWVSPGHTGVPDRICIFPNGCVVFVEVKAPDGQLRPAQKRWGERLKELNCNWHCVYDKSQVDELVEFYIDIKAI